MAETFIWGTPQIVTIDANDKQDHRLIVDSRNREGVGVIALPKDPRHFTETFSTPEDGVVLMCAVHASEIGWLTVVPHPHYAITSPTGEYKLPFPIPPGTYTLRSYHPKL